MCQSASHLTLKESFPARYSNSIDTAAVDASLLAVANSRGSQEDSTAPAPPRPPIKPRLEITFPTASPLSEAAESTAFSHRFRVAAFLVNYLLLRRQVPGPSSPPPRSVRRRLRPARGNPRGPARWQKEKEKKETPPSTCNVKDRTTRYRRWLLWVSGRWKWGPD